MLRYNQKMIENMQIGFYELKFRIQRCNLLQIEVFKSIFHLLCTENASVHGGRVLRISSCALRTCATSRDEILLSRRAILFYSRRQFNQNGQTTISGIVIQKWPVLAIQRSDLDEKLSNWSCDMYLWILEVSGLGKICGQRTRVIKVLEKVQKFRKCWKTIGF